MSSEDIIVRTCSPLSDFFRRSLTNAIEPTTKYSRGRDYIRLIFHFPLHSTQPGDIVTVNHGNYGRREGLVIGSHIDLAVRPPSSSPS